MSALKRIGVFGTFDSDGEPTAVGTYFNLVHAEINIKSSNNTNVSSTRDGNIVIINDPLKQFPVSGSLIISKYHLDMESGANYQGLPRYLMTSLYYHFSNHLNLVIFQENMLNRGRVAYVVRILDFDEAILSHASFADVFSETSAKIGMQRMNQPSTYKFDLAICLNGKYTDINDVTSATWKARS